MSKSDVTNLTELAEFFPDDGKPAKAKPESVLADAARYLGQAQRLVLAAALSLTAEKDGKLSATLMSSARTLINAATARMDNYNG